MEKYEKPRMEVVEIEEELRTDPPVNGDPGTIVPGINVPGIGPSTGS